MSADGSSTGAYKYPYCDFGYPTFDRAQKCYQMHIRALPSDLESEVREKRITLERAWEISDSRPSLKLDD